MMVLKGMGNIDSLLNLHARLDPDVPHPPPPSYIIIIMKQNHPSASAHP